VRLRHGIAAAIDKRAIVRKLAFGAGTVASEDLPSFMWAYDARVRAESYDPVRARALLAAAGWRPGADGIAYKNGRRLGLVFAYALNNETARLIVLQIQSYLRAVGIDVQLKGYNSALMFAPYAAAASISAATSTWLVHDDAGRRSGRIGRFTSGAVPPHGQNIPVTATPRWTRRRRRTDELRSRAASVRTHAVRNCWRATSRSCSCSGRRTSTRATRGCTASRRTRDAGLERTGLVVLTREM